MNYAVQSPITSKTMSGSSSFSKQELVNKTQHLEALQHKATGLRKAIHQTDIEIQTLRQEKLAVDAKKNSLKQEISGYDAQLASLAADKLKINYEKDELVNSNQKLELANKQIQIDLVQNKNEKIKLQEEKDAIQRRKKNLEEQLKTTPEKPALPARTLPAPSATTVKQETRNDEQTKLRNAVLDTLPKVFYVDIAVIKASFKDAQLDAYRLDVPNKRLIINQAAMKGMVEFLKAHKEVVKVNFVGFKDEFKEEALVTFFEALPVTGVKSLGLEKILSDTEKTALSTAQQKSPDLKVVNKAK